MFSCEKCGSSYSAMHAVAIENCPRCLARDQVTSRLVFKPFGFPGEAGAKLHSVPLTAASERAGEDRRGSETPLAQPKR
jgi:hypothetical protein